MQYLDGLLKLYVRHFPLDKGKTRLIETRSRLFPLSGVCQVLTNFSATMNLDLRQYVQRQIYFRGAYEENVLRLMRAFHETQSIEIMVDAGANVGQHSLFAAVALTVPKIYAFEPARAAYDRSKENVSLNHLDGVIRVFNCALSDEETIVSLVLPSKSNDGLAYIKRLASDDAEGVPAIRLDNFAEAHGIDHIDLLKVDVEG